MDGTITGFTAIRQDISDRKRVEELSITDRLTQLYNRLKLDTTFEEEIHRTDRFGRPLSVILFDVDHFKSVNDTYGQTSFPVSMLQCSHVLLAQRVVLGFSSRWQGRGGHSGVSQQGGTQANQGVDQSSFPVRQPS
ncbi:MAG: diguanylate cyclase [Magnetococcales bacterium]|nr:diguanylate cyclase [Magnetococcales bacterium]